MTLEISNAEKLLELLLDKGLSYVASYFEKTIHCSIIITDYHGKIHYPENKNTSLSSIFIDIPSDIDKQSEYYYHEAKQLLFFPIKYYGNFSYIIVKNPTINKIPQIISIFNRDAKLVIKCYFSNYTKLQIDTSKFEKKFVQNLLLKNNTNIRDLLKLSQKDLDLNKPYFIGLIKIDSENKIDWELLRSYMFELQRSKNLDLISIIGEECLIGIVPGKFKKNTLYLDPAWPDPIDFFEFKKTIDKKFNINTSHGIGRVYKLEELHKSYNEAQIALTLAKLMGKKSFIQEFSKMDEFTLIFSNDLQIVKEYCCETLGLLIEYDNNNHGELLPTLRKLLDSSINWKSTAEFLHIHINTLYYRINQIEQILNIDFSKMDARTKLYTAIKVWDTLETIGYY